MAKNISIGSAIIIMLILIGIAGLFFAFKSGFGKAAQKPPMQESPILITCPDSYEVPNCGEAFATPCGTLSEQAACGKANHDCTEYSLIAEKLRCNDYCGSYCGAIFERDNFIQKCDEKNNVRCFSRLQCRCASIPGISKNLIAMDIIIKEVRPLQEPPSQSEPIITSSGRESGTTSQSNIYNYMPPAYYSGYNYPYSGYSPNYYTSGGQGTSQQPPGNNYNPPQPSSGNNYFVRCSFSGQSCQTLTLRLGIFYSANQGPCNQQLAVTLCLGALPSGACAVSSANCESA